jgi:hypothetical protein
VVLPKIQSQHAGALDSIEPKFLISQLIKIFILFIMTSISLSGDIFVRQNSGQFQYSSSNAFNTTTAIAAWPVSLNNTSGSNKNVFIVGNLQLTIANMYFIMGGPNITLDGQNNTVNVNNVSNYPGLVQNGTFSDGKNDIIIRNLGVTSTSSTLVNMGGWVGQQYMNKIATGCHVINCNSSGDISGQFAGGIFGFSSSGTATNCVSSGAINGPHAGGIFGSGSSGTATNCNSSGIVGQFAGGIFGSYSSGTAANCYNLGAISGSSAGGIFGYQSSGTAENCYNSITISGQQAGGIFGSNSSGTATNCNSSGAISGQFAGGIFGFGSSGTTVGCNSTGAINGAHAGGIFGSGSSGTATNCYSSGVIGQFAGGIFGSNSGSTAKATNCYSLGAISSGGIFGYQSRGTAENCYSSGLIGEQAGGIFGSYSSGTATNCNSSGAISGQFAGGIFGFSSSGTATNCNSTGAISGPHAGGIFGSGSSGTATNCNSSGVIAQFAGGIFGSNSGSTATAANCNSSGAISGTSSGGIFGYQSRGTATNCYSSITISGQQSGGIFGSNSSGTATNCYSIGDISGQFAGGIFGFSSSGTATNCNSTGAISGLFTGGIFGNGSTGTATTCYSSGVIGQFAGGIFGANSGSTAKATNCYSSGAINGSNAGGIFGYQSSGTAENCYSSGLIGEQAGGIFGGYSIGGISTNCYSIGDISGKFAGGIFGFSSSGTSTKCYSSGAISGQFAGGIFGAATGTATNCYSSGAIGPYAGGIFGGYSTGGTATNCYSSGTIGQFAGGIFGYQSSGTNNNSRNTNGWSDTTAVITIGISGAGPTYTNGTLTEQGTTWIDINLSATDTPWLLKSFNSQLYSPNTQTITTSSGSTSNAIIISGVDYQIIDVNNTIVNASNFTGISSSTGAITFSYLDVAIYTIRVLRKTTGSTPPVGYQINTLTITITYQPQSITLSGDIYVRQNSGQFQYSSSSSFNATTPITAWPVTLNNISGSNKNVFIVGNLELFTANMYFIMGSQKITLDGQNNTVNVNNVSNYPGLVQNGTSFSSGQNTIIIQNLGITSAGSTSLAERAGWVGQRYMNKNANSCQVNNCYSSGSIIGIGAGGTIGGDSSGTATNCYSTGAINGEGGGGIFGGDSSGTATNCYSSGPINGPQAGGIFGAGSNSGTATNCYSSGAISSGSGAQGIFGPDSDGTNTTQINSQHTTGWSDTTAATTIGISGAGPTYTNGTLTAQGTTWIDINLSATDTPWLLKSFNNQLYSPNTLTTTNASGTTSSAIISTGVDYQIIDVNNTLVNASNFTGISSSSGVITFGNIVAGTYTLRVLRKNAGSTPPVGYQINTMTITYQPPFTNFTLSPASVNERALYSGTLTSDSTTTTQYSILSQAWDNLYVSGNTLNARYGISYRDFQNYPVQISGTSNGITLIRSFNIQIVNLPDAPIEVFLSNSQIPENSAIGSVVGTLQTFDLDPGNTFTYQLVSGAGSSDNSSFRIQNDVLYTATTFNYNTKNVYSIRVKSTDNTGLYVENPILLSVVLPTAVSLEISGVGNAFQIELKGQSVNGGDLSFEIIRQPSFGSLVPSNTNGVFVYTSDNTTTDSFQYVVREGSMTSLPATVIVYKYNQTDVSNIPLNMGPIQFSSIDALGTKWTLGGGIISTDLFIQNSSSITIGGIMTIGTIS